MKRYTYVNGKILPHEKAVVRVDDIAISRGFGIYEGIATYMGQPFEFRAHYERLMRSAKVMGLRVPVSERELKSIILKLIEKNPFRHPLARVLLTGGTVLHGIDFDPRHPTLIVMLEETPILPKKIYSDGAKVIAHEYQRQVPEAKTVNYIMAVRLQARLRKARALEVIYTWKGKMLEASTSNVFIVRKGVVITPKKEVLGGITRQIVLKLARSAYQVEERDVSVREMLTADEVFLTSSFKEIVPIAQIGGKRIGKPGKITHDLMQRFADYTKKK